eukprot:c1307_g1_i1.p1 GENE.c1307_g1_i1~~c1307_g1_i1.p1  ORF type:complete len:274 (+),score=34.06 c1307_g1_i1:106-822(+)
MFTKRKREWRDEPLQTWRSQPPTPGARFFHQAHEPSKRAKSEKLSRFVALSCEAILKASKKTLIPSAFPVDSYLHSVLCEFPKGGTQSIGKLLACTQAVSENPDDPNFHQCVIAIGDAWCILLRVWDAYSARWQAIAPIFPQPQLAHDVDDSTFAALLTQVIAQEQNTVLDEGEIFKASNHLRIMVLKLLLLIKPFECYTWHWLVSLQQTGFLSTRLMCHMRLWSVSSKKDDVVSTDS